MPDNLMNIADTEGKNQCDDLPEYWWRILDFLNLNMKKFLHSCRRYRHTG